MPHARRVPVAVAGAAVLAVLTLLTGCATAVSGDGTPASALATTAPSSASSPPTTAPTDTPATSATATTAPASDLSNLLAPAPADSRPWGTPWSKNVSPTTAQFVAHVYPASSVALVKSQLAAQGLTDIAHRTWIATDANQADTILLRFHDPAGARSRYLSATAAKAADAAQRNFTVPAFPEAMGYYDPKLDSLGDVRTIVYGQVGDVVLEVFFYSPAKLDKAAAIAAASTQLRLLP